MASFMLGESPWRRHKACQSCPPRRPPKPLDPMKEAPSIEGAFLVSETPPIGKGYGVGYW